MAALTSNYEDAQILIYDLEGNKLSETVVTAHDKASSQIKVRTFPKGMKANDDCRLLILTSPAPCEYQGKLKKVGADMFIALFQGHEKESRTAARFTVTTPATIDLLICDGKPYELLSPVNVTLLNISTSGVRFRAPYYTLFEGSKFRLNMTISSAKKQLIAEVVNHLDKDTLSSDYGCRFVES